MGVLLASQALLVRHTQKTIENSEKRTPVVPPLYIVNVLHVFLTLFDYVVCVKDYRLCCIVYIYIYICLLFLCVVCCVCVKLYV